MWLEAVDLVLSRLQSNGTPFGRIRGISGAGQQHGSVFWNERGEKLLGSLKKEESIVEQLCGKGEAAGFAHLWSPNWQDASTQRECDRFDAELGSEEKLANVTGSKAHHVSTLLCAVAVSTDDEPEVHRTTDHASSEVPSRCLQEHDENIPRLVVSSLCLSGQGGSYRY